MTCLAKRLGLCIAYLAGFLWLISGVLYLAFGSTATVNLSYNIPLSTEILTQFANNLRMYWPNFVALNVVGVLADLFLIPFGVIIAAVFIRADVFLQRLTVVSMAIAGLLPLIADIMNFAPYHVLGVMASGASDSLLSAMAAIFSVFSEGSIWLVAFAYLFGAAGFLFTRLMTKTCSEVSSWWQKYTTFLVFLYLATSILSMITLLTLNPLLLVISLTLIMLITPLAYLLWVFGLSQLASRIVISDH